MPTLSDESSRLPGQNAQRCRGFSLAAATEGERNSRVQTRCNNARLCTRGWNEFEKRVRVRGRVGADLRVRPGCAFPQEGAHIGAPLRYQPTVICADADHDGRAAAAPARQSRLMPAGLRGEKLQDLAAAKAAHSVIVDHPGRLHMGIANRRADELETALF